MSLPAPRELLNTLVALPGPPGQEAAVRAYVQEQVRSLGCTVTVDPKGNLLTAPGDGALPERPRIVVTAHLDEIALMVRAIADDGSLGVRPLGGAHPWKWGEGPVEVFARGGALLPGILSFGSIHTESPLAPVTQAREGRAVTWDMASILTGLSAERLIAAGVRPGSRVVIARSRRVVSELAGGQLLASYFLDDRADLVAWLLALERLRAAGAGREILFAATTSEEVGGEGALYLLHRLQPDVCVALEIGPSVPDAPVPLDTTPTVWVSDAYATMAPEDLDLLEEAAKASDLPMPHWQAISRGGSDATCAAARGLCARPVTLAFPAENSHGFEIMHRDAPGSLADLLIAYLNRLSFAA